MSIATETKVGLLVVAAAGGLLWVSTQAGLISTGLSKADMRSLSTTFSDVGAIKVGTPVKMAGVEVGDVTDIQLQPSGTAIVKYEVKKSAPIPADATAQITTSGLIGEQYLALVPGTQSLVTSETTMLLPPPATTLPSGGGAGKGDMAGNFGKVGEDLQAMTGTLRTVLGDPENAKKLQGIIDGLAKFADNVGGEGDGTMGKFDHLADSLDKLADRMNAGDSTLGALLAKDDGKTKQTINDLNAAMKDLRQVMAKVNNGDGTIGKLINDPQTADKIDSALDTLASVGERVEQFRTEVDFNGYSLTNERGIGKGEATITLQPRPTRFYVLGATSDGFAGKERSFSDTTNPYFHKDFGSRTKLTAQFGHVFQNALFGNDLALRAGLKNSTGGVGVDYGFNTGMDNDWGFLDAVKLSADAYDFSGSNTPGSDTAHVDVKAKANLWNKMFYAIAGYDNLLNQEYGSPIFGLGLRFQDDDLKYMLGKAL